MTSPSSPPDLRSALQQSLGSAYTLERELTGGGMSRVFVATEIALGRRVVVKVLAPDLAEGISLERFEREIRMLASLQQANIVPLLSAGRTGLLPFYTMPFVEGRSIRDRIEKDGPLSIGEATNILRDVARALMYAHEHGIVHRDIKPDNILLSGDTAVVADFGIAKALSAARADREHTLTQTGFGIGTPAYMAPEQAIGDPDVDSRADIYAFGCVAYEVLSGKPPFAGRQSHLIVAAHMSEVPVAVSHVRADVPAALCTLVTKCLEKDPAHRPQNARELIQALDAALTSSPQIARPKQKARLTQSAFMIAVAAAVFAIGGFFVWRASATSNELASLAVLPFLNVGGDSLQEYLADGIRDELATAIGKVPGMRLIGRSAAFQYHGRRDLDARNVGHALGARYLLQGSLAQRDGRLKVSAQLTDSTGGTELWSLDFVQSSNELSQVKDSIVRAIAASLHKTLAMDPVAERSRLHPADSDSAHSEAYDLYLRGVYLLQRRGPGVKQSIANFEQAIAKDDQYARAYAGLSAALVLIPYFDGTLPSELYARATNAAHRALQLDSTLALARSTLAIAYWNNTQLDSADVEFRHAIQTDPTEVNTRVQYARFLLTLGRTKDAIGELQRARQLDPLSPVQSAWIAYAMYADGNEAQALTEIDRAAQIDSTMLPVLNNGSLLNIAVGRTVDAMRYARRIPAGSVMSQTPLTYAVAGDTATAMQILRRMEAREPQPWFTDVMRASVMLAIRDTSQALDALERSAHRSGSMWTQYIMMSHPIYDPLRKSQRFAALLRKAKLNEAMFTSATGGRKK